MLVIFCDSLIDRKVDPDFVEEYNAAILNGHQVSLLSFEDLEDDNVAKAILRVKPREDITLAVYRGWMIGAAKYEVLYHALLHKQIRLIKCRDYQTAVTRMNSMDHSITS